MPTRTNNSQAGREEGLCILEIRIGLTRMFQFLKTYAHNQNSDLAVGGRPGGRRCII